MKVVVNRCYGGFGISDEAVMRYAELSGILLFKKADNRFSSIPMIHYYTDASCADEYYWYHTSQIERNDPILVKVVEELGERSHGYLAKLEIVEIPEGIDWHIDEYDGIESVHENHRSW
jgi:hypothetical protein